MHRVEASMAYVLQNSYAALLPMAFQLQLPEAWAAACRSSTWS